MAQTPSQKLRHKIKPLKKADPYTPDLDTQTLIRQKAFQISVKYVLYSLNPLFPSKNYNLGLHNVTSIVTG